MSFAYLLHNWSYIFIDKVKTFENAYQMSCFIAEVREILYLWFMFQLITGLCFKLWQFNTKIGLQTNTKFLIITDRIITFKLSTHKMSFFSINLEFSHAMVIVTFSTMYKSYLVWLKEKQKEVNCFHDTNIETGIECTWRWQSIIQVIKTICWLTHLIFLNYSENTQFSFFLSYMTAFSSYFLLDRTD